MDLMEGLQLLAGYYDPPCTPAEVVTEVAELDHDAIDEDVDCGEITDPEIEEAFRTVIDASEEDLADAVEEIACGARHCSEGEV